MENYCPAVIYWSYLFQIAILKPWNCITDNLVLIRYYHKAIVKSMWAPIASDKLFVSYTLHDGSLEHLNTCIAFGRSYKSPEGTIWLMAYISGSAWVIHFHSDDAAASQFHWMILKSLTKLLFSKAMFTQQLTFWEDINLEIWMEMLVCW